MTVHSPSSFLKEDANGNRSLSNTLEDGEHIVGTGRVDNIPVVKESAKKSSKKAKDDSDADADDQRTDAEKEADEQDAQAKAEADADAAAV